MKLKLLPLFIFFFLFSHSQTNYEKEIIELKKYVHKTYEENYEAIERYVVNPKNGNLYKVKTEDIFSEFEFELENVYEFLRKNDKVICARKSPISQSGDSNKSYFYYFAENGRLIGAEKFVSSFYGDNKIVNYTIQYELSEKTDKLERVKEEYTDEDDKVIKRNSRLYKIAVEDGMISYYIPYLDKITFRDLEGFMNTENLKYYKDNEVKTPAVSNLIRGRNAKENFLNTESESRIGVDRKLISFIPGTVSRGGEHPKHNCIANGTIIISYNVDKDGNVSYARRSGGTSDPCIVSTSISWVKEFVKAEKSDRNSIGRYKISF